jgi:hypothetical protein
MQNFGTLQQFFVYHFQSIYVIFHFQKNLGRLFWGVVGGRSEGGLVNKNLKNVP